MKSHLIFFLLILFCVLCANISYAVPSLKSLIDIVVRYTLPSSHYKSSNNSDEIKKNGAVGIEPSDKSDVNLLENNSFKNESLSIDEYFDYVSSTGNLENVNSSFYYQNLFRPSSFIQTKDEDESIYKKGPSSGSSPFHWISLQREYQPKFLPRKTRFDGDKLIQICNLSKVSLAELESMVDLDIWKIEGTCLIARSKPVTINLLRKKPDLLINIINDNLQGLIDEETLRLESYAAGCLNESNPISFFTEFRSYNQTLLWYKDLAAAYPSLVEFIPSIGKTVENRDIFAVKIGNKSVSDKEAIFIHALQHPREWISGSTVNYIVYQLLNNNLQHSNLTDLLNQVELIVVPVMNPDGYEYSWSTNRLWRKNRKPNLRGWAVGVDLNRNWETHWGESGSSNNPFSDTYMGPSPASELEVQAMQNFFLNNTNIIGGVDFHAYSQLIMWPYGYSRKLYPFHDQHKDLCERMALSIKKKYGNSYTCQRICDLYVASGNSVDFYSSDRVAKTFGHRPYALALELRPRATDPRGFLLGPEDIIPAGEETIPALLEFMSYASVHKLL